MWRTITLVLGLAALVMGCAPAADPSREPAVDCAHPPDLRPTPVGAAPLPLGGIAVGYRDWQIASRACDEIVVVGAGHPVVFGDVPISWIAHARVPPGLGPQARLRVVISRLEDGRETAISDADHGNVEANPYGLLDPRERLASGTYRMRILADGRLVADDGFTVATAPPASIGP